MCHYTGWMEVSIGFLSLPSSLKKEQLKDSVKIQEALRGTLGASAALSWLFSGKNMTELRGSFTASLMTVQADQRIAPNKKQFDKWMQLNEVLSSQNWLHI